MSTVREMINFSRRKIRRAVIQMVVARIIQMVVARIIQTDREFFSFFFLKEGSGTTSAYDFVGPTVVHSASCS